MPIKIQGQVNVEAPRQEVWDSILDLQVLKSTAAHVPGVDVERLDQIDDMHYEGTATIGVAAVKGKYDGTITILEKRPPEFMRLKGEGKGGGNWTSGEISMTLAEQDGKTTMTYAGQGNLGGPLASVGQRLVDTVGRQIIDQGTKVLAEEIAARHRARSGGAAAVGAAGAASGAPAPMASAAATPSAKSGGISSQTIAVVIGVLVVLALVAYFGFLR